MAPTSGTSREGKTKLQSREVATGSEEKQNVKEAPSVKVLTRAKGKGNLNQQPTTTKRKKRKRVKPQMLSKQTKQNQPQAKVVQIYFTTAKGKKRRKTKGYAAEVKNMASIGLQNAPSNCSKIGLVSTERDER